MHPSLKRVCPVFGILASLFAMSVACSWTNPPTQAPPITQVVQVVQVVTVTQVVPVIQVVTVTQVVPVTPVPPGSEHTSGPGNNTNCALQFDGFDDYVYLGKWFDYSTFTISMWVNPGASQQNEYADIIDNNHTDYRSWVLQQNRNNTNSYYWGTAFRPPVRFVLAANRWQHIAISREAGAKVYINSELVGADTGSPSVTYDGTQVMHLARWGAGGRNWNGQMDDVQIWSVALTQEQIQENMHRRLTGNEEGLLAYYRFDECAGTQLVDSSPNGHDGTLVDGPVWVASGVELGE